MLDDWLMDNALPQNDSLNPAEHERHRSSKTRWAIRIPVAAILFLGLYYVSKNNYLLFHSSIELFAVVVACGIFMFGWNTRQFVMHDYFIFIGIAYLFVAMLDLLHALGYAGMAVFTGYDTNLPTQLWIFARYTEAVSLLLAPMFLHRRLFRKTCVTVFSAVFLIIIADIFRRGVFPDCFVAGKGLTSFKVISEWVISFALLAAAFRLFRNRDAFDPRVLSILIASILITIGSELSFTLYTDPYGFSNTIGHLLKLISFYLIYKAVIQTGLVRPYNILFRDLKKRESELQEALDNIKTLRDMIPICSHCKKVRDDDGYWEQVDIYIREHAGVEFSHGLCPTCAKKLYPKYHKEDRTH